MKIFKVKYQVSKIDEEIYVRASNIKQAFNKFKLWTFDKWQGEYIGYRPEPIQITEIGQAV